ncbi:MAG TPA: TldD/PmbA family protein [Nitrospirota bacterium]|nr:TldD/PmbA family protein [Nitrospirota bacterium]
MERETAERILSLAASLKTDAADVFLRAYSSTTVEVKDQQVDAFERARDVGVGLRVLVGSRMGFAFTTDFSGQALETLVRAAVTNAETVEEDPFHSIPPKAAAPYSPAVIYDPELPLLTEKEKIDRVMAMEREAYNVDGRIKRIRKASASFSDAETLIMNSHGAEVAYRSTACSSSIEVVAEDKGESQAGSEFDVSRFYRRLRIEEVGRKAAERALDLLGARHIDSVKAPIVIEAPVAQEFLSLMAGGFSAESVQKKRSLFMNRLGTEVAAPLVTVVDDGLLDGGLGSAPSDDETVPLRKKTVINAGRLELFLYNTYTANKDKTVSTGNGMRGGFKGMPGVGVTNLYIEPGKEPLGGLLSSLDSGLFVTEVMGMHTANPISGDFSVGATGFWIEKGKKAYPVREITIAGNILDLMRHVDAVGSDLRFSGRIGSPSLRIKELSIGGK